VTLCIYRPSGVRACSDDRGYRSLERAMGIEPTSEAWEALSKTLKAIDLAALSFPGDGLNWNLDGN
jgi:hypothetical protein